MAKKFGSGVGVTVEQVKSLEDQWSYAVDGKHIEEMERLLKSGLSPDTTLNNNISTLKKAKALAFAYRKDDPTYLQAFNIINSTTKLKAIHLASSLKNIPMIKLLVKYKADVSLPGQGGITPIQQLASTGSAEGVEILLAAGADPDQKHATGWRPIHCAAFNRHEGVLEVLFNVGAYSDEVAEEKSPLSSLHIHEGCPVKDLLVQAYERYLSKAEKNAGFYYNRGQYKKAARYFEDAIKWTRKNGSKDLKKLAELESQCAKSYHELYKSAPTASGDKDEPSSPRFLALSHYTGAIELLNQAIEGNGDDATLHVLLGKTLSNNSLMQATFGNAVWFYTEAKQPEFVYPDDPAQLIYQEIRFLLPFYRLHGLKAAISSLKRAVALEQNKETSEILARYKKSIEEEGRKIEQTQKALVEKYTKLKDSFDDHCHKVYCSKVMELIPRIFEAISEAQEDATEDLKLCVSDAACLIDKAKVQCQISEVYKLITGILKRQIVSSKDLMKFDFLQGLASLYAVMHKQDKDKGDWKPLALEYIYKGMYHLKKVRKMDLIVRGKVEDLDAYIDLLSEMKRTIAPGFAESELEEQWQDPRGYPDSYDMDTYDVTEYNEGVKVVPLLASAASGFQE